MTPSDSPTKSPDTAHQMPHASLFASKFWEVLPAHYDKIKTCLDLIARLHHEASTALMATDRAAAVNSLKAELEMLENDLCSYREIVKGIAIEDIVGIYVAGGRLRGRAEQIAKEDLEDLEKSLKQIEDKAKEMKADVVYGFEDKN